jgi:hypothetical protein
VINKKLSEKQRVKEHATGCTVLAYPSLEGALPKLLQNYATGCGM